MDMNKAFFLRKEDREPKWHLIDAKDRVLGRLATEVADLLRGKGKPTYTPQTASGDYVVIINVEKVKLTGNKLEDKIYQRVSGYMGGKKEFTARQILEKHPERIIEHAVKGMLPKNKLSNIIEGYLKLYVGSEHPHDAQIGL
jgi:large subunit ribosomal protein L13